MSRIKKAKRIGFTLVELLVVIAIIGILVALLLPAVQAARESARRSQCLNNMKQLVTGCQLYHDVNKVFPPGHTGFNPSTPDEDYQHCWMTLILPFVEQDALYDQYRFDKRWNQGVNGRYVTQGDNSNLSVQLCPSSEHVVSGQGDYAGINGSGTYNHDGLRIPDGYPKGFGYEAGLMPAIGPDPQTAKNSPVGIKHCTDGTSTTILVGEDSARNNVEEVMGETGGANRHWDKFWGYAHQTFAHHSPVLNPRNADGERQHNELGSDHPGGLIAGFADGHAQWLSDFTSHRVIDFMTTRATGEVIAGDDL